MDRRTFTKSIPLALAAVGVALNAKAANAAAWEAGSPVALPSQPHFPPVAIGMWVFPGMTKLDFVGAHGILSRPPSVKIHILGKILPFLGATPVHERVVIDRNRITGGGVTAGIDFGLTVVDQIWGREIAETIQLANDTIRTRRSTPAPRVPLRRNRSRWCGRWCTTVSPS